METFSYSYCYVGIMTGPFFRYRTYLDWLEQPFPGAVPSLRPLLRRAWPAPLFGLLFLLSSHLFPLEAVREDAFYARPLPARLFYMIPVFFAFRMRFYVAWIAAECGCIAAGFGAYPVAAKARAGGGPTLQCPPPAVRRRRPPWSMTMRPSATSTATARTSACGCGTACGTGT